MFHLVNSRQLHGGSLRLARLEYPKREGRYIDHRLVEGFEDCATTGSLITTCGGASSLSGLDFIMPYDAGAIEGKLRVQSRASETLQDQIIEEIKEMEHTKTQEALQLASKEHDLWMYHNEKEEAKRIQGARKLRNDEEMAWAHPRSISKWPDWEEAREREESEWRLEPEWESESARNHCRVGCGERHFRGPGW